MKTLVIGLFGLRCVLYCTGVMFFEYRRPLKAHCTLENGPENGRSSVYYRCESMAESMWYAVLWHVGRARATRWHGNSNKSLFVM